MSDGMHGHGVTLKVNDGTSTTTIGNITSISGPDMSRDSIDKSSMDSTSKWREFIPGMLDSGEVTVEVNYDGADSGTANDLDVKKTATALTWIINFGDSTTTSETNSSNFSASGFITGLGYAIPFDDKISQSVTLKFTGSPTYTDITS